MNPGRLVIPALRWRPETGFAHEASTIATALEFGAGGFILFGGTADAVSQLTTDLTRQAGRPLLFAADLERGPGQQFEGLDELPPPLALASLNDPALLRGAGVLTAVEARSVGVNWVLAPVLDLDLEPANPIVQTRAFGSDPIAVGAAASAWIVGCEAAGAMSCAKHFPGHGRTRSDSHVELPVVNASAADLRADLEPYAAAVAAGVGSVMTAHVAYPALDPTGTPATCSAPILSVLRNQIGFSGLIVSDALVMAGARQDRSEEAASLAAVEAGVDLLLYPEAPAEVCRALVHRTETDARVGGLVEAALGRYASAVRQVGDDGPLERMPPAGSARALGDWLLSQPLLRGSIPHLHQPVELVVIDDDEGQSPPPSPVTWVRDVLQARGVRIGTGGSRVVLAFSEPRAWKGWAGFGPASRDRLARLSPEAALTVLFTHPRLLQAIPGDSPVLLAWHRQRLMQEAVARWLMDRLG